jgi:hypothetical protein
MGAAVANAPLRSVRSNDVELDDFDLNDFAVEHV